MQGMHERARSQRGSRNCQETVRPNRSAAATVSTDVTRTSRIALLTLTTLVAACLFSVALFAQTASADVTPALTTTYANPNIGGSGNVTLDTSYTYSDNNVSSGEDVKRL